MARREIAAIRINKIEVVVFIITLSPVDNIASLRRAAHPGNNE
jgi:hypothetical protein